MRSYTPIEIIMLAKRMRDAQKRWPSHPQQASIEVMALERELDDAIEPYVQYQAAMERAEG